MARLVMLPSKRPAEKVTAKFPFGDQLLFGETISGQVVTAVVFAGTDASPSSIIFGSATLDSDGVTVSQVIQAGTAGVIYQLVCTVTASGGNLYSKGAKQAIASDPGAFNGPA